MGKQIELKITADCTCNQANMTAHLRNQGLYIVNMSIVTSNIRNDTVVLYKYYDDTKSNYYFIGDDSASDDEDKWGIERYFTYTYDENIYGLSLADVLLNLFGFGGISIIYVIGKKELQDVYLVKDMDYELLSDEYTISIDNSTGLDEDSDLIIGYKLNMSQQYVNYMEFSSEKGFVDSYEIDYTIDLTNDKKGDYLGTFYTKFTEVIDVGSDTIVELNKGVDSTNYEYIIYSLNTTDSYTDQINGNKRIELDFSTYQDYINITYGIASYRLDRGYQLIEGMMSDSVRKASVLHTDNIIKDYSTGSAVDLSLMNVPADPDNPLEVNSPKLLISLPEEAPIELSFEYLPLLYGSTLNGSFYVDDCVLSQVSDETKPLLVSFTIITEDGEAYFDYMVINASEGDNYYDFNINLQPIYAIKGYTTIDIQISIMGFTNRTNSMQYIFLDKFQLLADDIILKTVDKPATDRRGKFDVELFLNSAHWFQCFTADLKDTYNVPDNSWMTIGVEGFDGFGELKQIKQDTETKELSFVDQGTEYSFQSLALHDRRLVDSIGFHLDCYDIEEPLYLEGLVSLYKGLGTHYDGSYEVENEQYAMDWQGNDYVVDIETFDASDYNDQFLLSDTPLSTNDYMDVSGSVYMHHRVNISDTNNLIFENLPYGVEFAYSIPTSTARIDAIEVENIERICVPYDWVESWQGYSFTQADFDELSPYNPEAMSFNPSARRLSSNNHYELVVNGTDQYLIYFYKAPINISILLDSDIIQIDFHISYWFTQNDYDIAEDEYTFNARLYWKFPVAWGAGLEELYDWTDFAYHPDLTSTATFNATFVKLTDYATKQNYKSSQTEEFQFYPRDYNFTTFEYEGYNQWVTVNLTYGGEFQERWTDIKPFGLNVITDEGEEKFLSAEHICLWQYIGDNQPIFKFKLSYPEIQYINITVGSEVLFTYYYLKDTLEFYTSYRDILYGSDKYSMVIKNSLGTEIPKYEVIASVEDNKITFNDAIRSYLAIGESFTIEYEFKTRGGLIESKHIFIEVIPYEMKFYNSYNMLSGGSIIAPLYYNLSSNFNYQLALNYRLMEKGIHSYSVVIDETANYDKDTDTLEVEILYNDPLQEDGDPIAFAYYDDVNDEKVWIDEDISYNSGTHTLTIQGISKYVYDTNPEGIVYLGDGKEITVQLASDLHNKYRHFHNFDINLRTDEIILKDWTVASDPANNLIANYESPHYIYDVKEKEDWAKGKVKQIFATLDDSNSLIYTLDEDLSDANGWEDYNILIMKMGLMNPYVLDHIDVKFYFTNASGLQLIGISEITLEMFDDDTGSVYIPLPDSNDWDQFTISKNAYIEFTPVFYEAEDFEGYFYEKGLPTMQTVIWDAASVSDGMVSITLEQEAFDSSQKVYVLNNLYEYIYAIDIDTFTQEFSYYDNKDVYELEFYNVSLPEFYNDTNGNLIQMRDEDIIYLKCNATLEKSIGLTVEEMTLQKDSYLPNFEEGQPDVPVAEISLLGVNVNDDEFSYSTVDDLFLNRTELVAWDSALDITPFEDRFRDTYKQMVFNISFNDINANFITTDEAGTQYSYITDILITSNDPSYELVVDSFFIFEFDYNATLYDSELFDMYPYNHMESFYYNYEDIYSTGITLNCSEYLPIYYYDQNINETFYFEAYGSNENYYYFGEHLFAQNISEGIYNITWNEWYSKEFYYEAKHAEDYEELMGYYEYYNPYIANYSYLYISWADSESWQEYRTIKTPNVNVDSIEVVYEYYNETTEEFATVYYNQSLSEFEVRQLAMEYLYPYNVSFNNYQFTLSQNYSQAIDLQILSVDGYYFDETKESLTGELLSDGMTIDITAPGSKLLSQYQFIVIMFAFNCGAYSDYTQIKLTQNAIDNHPEVEWSINDSLWVDYEYTSMDYFLLFEDYDVGSEESWFEYIPYIRNDKFVEYSDIEKIPLLDNSTQEYDFEAFIEIDDTRHVIEFYDFNMDAEYELIMEKIDLNEDGTYNSIKYGETNPAGEIVFHTSIASVSYTTTHTKKIEQERENPESFQLDFMNWIDKFNTLIYWNDETNSLDSSWDSVSTELTDGYRVYAKKKITSETTVETAINEQYSIIQKDYDMDGYPDKEFALSHKFVTVASETKSKEKTTIYFKQTPAACVNPEHQELKNSEEYIIQYLTTSYGESQSETMLLFRDFEQDKVAGSRLYKDQFPNEIADIYNSESYLRTIVNDLDDYDSYNDIETKIFDKEPLLSLTHMKDGVPAMYETVMEYSDEQFTTSNILAANKTLDIISGHSSWSGLDEERITLNTIKVAPKDGVYYDNNMGKYPAKTDGAYYYYDGDSDGYYETIFIADNDDDMIGVGFDYYSDAYFFPHARHLVERQVRRNRFSEDEGVFSVKNLIYNELLGYHHEDDSEGLYLEPTFSDALYDLWKTQWSDKSSQLIEEAEKLTFDRYLDSISAEQAQADIMWQTESLLISAAVGGAVSAVATPIAGAIAGAAVYATLSTLKGWLDVAEQENIIKAYTFHDSEHYKGKKTLSRKWWSDEWFGETMTTAFTSTTNGIYAPVVFETEKYTYEGQVVLAPADGRSGEGKTNMPSLDTIDWDTENWWDPFNTNYKKMKLDYAMQTRSYIAYSDFDDSRMIRYMEKEDIFYEYQDEILYSHNSIAYLENTVAETTDAKKDRDLNKVIPYMHDYYPVMLFANEKPTSPLPEFYENYPVIVSSEEYNEISKIGGSYTYDCIYKIWEKSDGEDLKIVAKNTLQGALDDIDVYLVSSYDDNNDATWEYDNFKKTFVATLDSDDYSFDPSTGKITLASDRYEEFCEKVDNRMESIESECDENYWEKYGQYYSAYLIFEIHIEKYRSIEDRGDLAKEQMEQIATMQSVQAAILEYYYQFQVATETQSKLDEVAYTVVITVVSTLLTAGIGSAVGLKGLTLWSVASEPFEEVFIDPLIEDAVAGMVRDMGGDEYMVVAATSIASMIRETRFGIFGGSQNIKQDVHASQEIDSTGRNTMQDIAEQDAQTREQ